MLRWLAHHAAVCHTGDHAEPCVTKECKGITTAWKRSHKHNHAELCQSLLLRSMTNTRPTQRGKGIPNSMKNVYMFRAGLKHVTGMMIHNDERRIAMQNFEH